MKVYIRGSEESGPWTSERIVRMFNKMTERIIGDKVFYDDEVSAIAANRRAGDAGDRTIVITIVSSDDDPCDNLSACELEN